MKSTLVASLTFAALIGRIRATVFSKPVYHDLNPAKIDLLESDLTNTGSGRSSVLRQPTIPRKNDDTLGSMVIKYHWLPETIQRLSEASQAGLPYSINRYRSSIEFEVARLETRDEVMRLYHLGYDDTMRARQTSQRLLWLTLSFNDAIVEYCLVRIAQHAIHIHRLSEELRALRKSNKVMHHGQPLIYFPEENKVLEAILLHRFSIAKEADRMRILGREFPLKERPLDDSQRVDLEAAEAKRAKTSSPVDPISTAITLAWRHMAAQRFRFDIAHVNHETSPLMVDDVDVLSAEFKVLKVWPEVTAIIDGLIETALRSSRALLKVRSPTSKARMTLESKEERADPTMNRAMRQPDAVGSARVLDDDFKTDAELRSNWKKAMLEFDDHQRAKRRTAHIPRPHAGLSTYSSLNETTIALLKLNIVRYMRSLARLAEYNTPRKGPRSSHRISPDAKFQVSVIRADVAYCFINIWIGMKQLSIISHWHDRVDRPHQEVILAEAVIHSMTDGEVGKEDLQSSVDELRSVISESLGAIATVNRVLSTHVHLLGDLHEWPLEVRPLYSFLVAERGESPWDKLMSVNQTQIDSLILETCRSSSIRKSARSSRPLKSASPTSTSMTTVKAMQASITVKAVPFPSASAAVSKATMAAMIGKKPSRSRLLIYRNWTEMPLDIGDDGGGEEAE